MRFDVLDSYESAIRKISGHLAEDSEVDGLGFDREDYRSELRIHSWDAQMFFRTHHMFCTPAEERYVHKALWNAAKIWKRSRHRREIAMAKLTDVVHHYHEEEGRLAARVKLRKLREHLRPEEFQVLQRVGEASGCLSEALADGDGTLDQFRWKVRTLRKRSKKILDGADAPR
jgi:hypothetical protein